MACQVLQTTVRRNHNPMFHLVLPAHSQQGYTLIEIMVATAILVTMAGAGIATFSVFSDRQQTLEAAKTLQVWLRTAQAKAQALEKPAGCAQLHSYRLRLTDESNQAVLAAVCNSSNQEIAPVTLNLPGTVVADVSTTLDFQVLRGGIKIGTGVPTINLIVKKVGITTYRYSFTVTQGGEVREGSYL